MRKQRTSLILIGLLILIIGCNGQNRTTSEEETYNKSSFRQVGGPCDTCELMYIGKPTTINETDTSLAWASGGQKLVISGTVYENDQRSPAPNILIYYWQTNDKGLYEAKPDQEASVRPHGYIRGWVKTDNNGQYEIYTIKPASYPNSTLPAHIHFLIKEPELPNEYYIDDIVFEDDPLLTEMYKKKMELRGGSGVVKTSKKGTTHYLYAERDIILGRNINGHPDNR